MTAKCNVSSRENYFRRIPGDIRMCLWVHSFCVFLMKHQNVIGIKKKWEWNPFCVCNWRTGYWRDFHVTLFGKQCQRGELKKKVHAFMKITEQKSQLHMNRHSISPIVFFTYLWGGESHFSTVSSEHFFFTYNWHADGCINYSADSSLFRTEKPSWGGQQNHWPAPS